MTLRRILTLGMAAVLAIAVVVPALAAAPGQRQATIQLTFDVADGSESFVASGAGFCSSGWADGGVIEYIEFGDSFKILMTKTLHCDDGSGDLQIRLSAGEPTGSPTRSGGWIVVGGTGDYATAVGGGTMTAKTRYPHDSQGVDTMIGVITR